MLVWYLLVRAGAMLDDGEEAASSTSFKEVELDVAVRGILITLAVAGGGAGLGVCVLWFYHVFLIFTGMTTKEHLRGKSGEDLTLCAPRGPRLFDPRSIVEAVKIGAPGTQRRWQLKGLDENVFEV